jgi:hypothetical protein
MLIDHIPRCPCSLYVIMLHNRIVNVLEEFMEEAGAIKGRDLRSEVRRIRYAASRDRPKMSCGLILRLRISTWLLMLRSLVRAQIPAFRL